MRYAVLQGGVVVNVIVLADPNDYQAGEVDLVPVDEVPEVGMGWERDGSEWVDTRPAPEPPPEPAPMTVRQKSPDGTWWEQRVNDDGVPEWVPVDSDPPGVP